MTHETRQPGPLSRIRTFVRDALRDNEEDFTTGSIKLELALLAIPMEPVPDSQILEMLAQHGVNGSAEYSSDGTSIVSINAPGPLDRIPTGHYEYVEWYEDLVGATKWGGDEDDCHLIVKKNRGVKQFLCAGSCPPVTICCHDGRVLRDKKGEEKGFRMQCACK